MTQRLLRDHACSHRPRHLRSLFRCETPVVGRTAPGYRIAPSHLIFTKPKLLRTATRFSVTSPLAVKPRRRRAWRSQVHHRVRNLNSRFATASLPLLGAAAAFFFAVSYFLRFFYLRHQSRSGPVTVPDWLSCSRGGLAGPSVRLCLGLISKMNTTSKPGSSTQTDRETCPDAGL